MSDLHDLYRLVVLEHSRRPRNEPPHLVRHDRMGPRKGELATAAAGHARPLTA